MNIFKLDSDPVICAKYHCDRHLVKMPVEYLDLLQGMDNELGRWVWSSKENFNWLKALSINVCSEFLFRYGQIHHKAREIALISTPPLLPDTSDTKQPFINEGIKTLSSDLVENYRNIYRGPKRHLCTWSHRLPPDWFTIDLHEGFIGTNKLFQELINGRQTY